MVTFLKMHYKPKRYLKKKGYDVGLINVRSLQPIDQPAILEAAATSKQLVIMEDHFKIGGLYSIVAELLTEKRKTVPIKHFSLGNHWFKPGLLQQVIEFEGFLPEQMEGEIIKDFQTI